MKIIKYSVLAFILSIALQICNGCANVKIDRFTRSDKQLKRYYKKANINAELAYFKVGENTIRAMRIGDTTLPNFLMLHGSPGSSMDYDSYIEDTTLTNHYCLLICDRPGYGYSNWGKVDTSVLHQSKVILKALSPWLKDKQFAVLGNSFGGPIAATVAALSKGKANHLVLVASSIAPGEERIYGISKTIIKPSWKWLFPTMAYLPSAEKLTHEKALQTIAPIISTYSGSILMLHGTADNLVYYSNTDYAKKIFTKAKKLTIADFPGEGHPILWNNKERVKKLILTFMKY